VRLYVASAPTDLRKGFDGLSALVHSQFALDPMRDGVFIFLNRRMTQMRALFWDRDGYCVVAKRLEEGTFRRVRTQAGAACVQIDAGELAMLLEGIEAKEVRRRKRYRAPESGAVPARLRWQAARSMNAPQHEHGSTR
jgi:transposase